MKARVEHIEFEPSDDSSNSSGGGSDVGK